MIEKEKEDYEIHKYRMKITGNYVAPSLDFMFQHVDVIEEKEVEENIYELDIGTHSNNHFWLSTGTEEVPLGLVGYDEEHISVEILEQPKKYEVKND